MNFDYLNEHTCFGGLVRLVVIVAVCAYCATAGFVINTTEQFDAGTKSNSSGNYEVETYTDNLKIGENTISLASKYSDRFTFDDEDADTWKWVWYGDDAFCSYDHDIADGKATMTIYGDWQCYQFMRLRDVYFGTATFDMQVNYSDFSTDVDYVYPAFGVANNENIWAASFYAQIGRINEAAGDTYAAFDGYGGVWAEDATTDTEGALRLTRTIIDTDTCNYTWYYWGSGDWVELEAYQYDGDTIPCGNMSIFLSVPFYNDGTGTLNISFDDFLVNTGTLYNQSYRTNGTWTSANITREGDLANTTITSTLGLPIRYITNMDWISGGSTNASCSTNFWSATKTIYERDLTSGAYDDLNEDFQIKLDWNTTITTAGGIHIKNVSGEFFAPEVETEYVYVKTSTPLQTNDSEQAWLLVGAGAFLLGAGAVVMKKR